MSRWSLRLALVGYGLAPLRGSIHPARPLRLSQHLEPLIRQRDFSGGFDLAERAGVEAAGGVDCYFYRDRLDHTRRAADDQAAVVEIAVDWIETGADDRCGDRA